MYMQVSRRATDASDLLYTLLRKLIKQPMSQSVTHTHTHTPVDCQFSEKCPFTLGQRKSK